MQLVKLYSLNLICPKIIPCEYFLDEILLDEKKANYGILPTVVKYCCRDENHILCGMLLVIPSSTRSKTLQHGQNVLVFAQGCSCPIK